MKTLNNISKIATIIFVAAAVFACDKVEGPYGVLPDLGEPSEVSRKGVIFDFTGIHCTQCPEAHEYVSDIEDAYGGHVIPISIHAGFFAIPDTDEGEPDLRSEFGDNLFNNIPGASTPGALISSLNVENFVLGSPATWQGTLGNFIPEYTKYIIRPTYSTDTSLHVQFEVEEREAISNPLQMFAFVVEDSIVAHQSGVEEDELPYTHRHVLRKCISNIDGNAINLNNGEASMIFSTNIDDEWDQEHLSVVGIIIDAETKEILTGEKIHLNFD